MSEPAKATPMQRIACVDVHYREQGATAACVLLDSWSAGAPILELTQHVDQVAPYEPGNFYRRELPCIEVVLGKLNGLPDIVVIDGYVWLGEQSKPGLGAKLHDALQGKVAVIGVAKTYFPHGQLVLPVFRGISKQPLYVSAAGASLEEAGEWVRNMHGASRIPTILRRVDKLSRSD
jgi:deoxyribonuclease V